MNAITMENYSSTYYLLLYLWLYAAESACIDVYLCSVSASMQENPNGTHTPNNKIKTNYENLLLECERREKKMEIQ